jgi:ABC-type lipoprotein release transport system permease subunit
VARFLVRGLVVSTIGSLAGPRLGVLLSQALQSMLCGVTAADTRNLLAMVLLVLAFTTAAGFIPSVRAALPGPAKVLREE